MLRCLQLAGLGAGKVAPNPMVGCVIVHNGQIIGEGYHQKLGEAHAEVNAIRSAKDSSLLSESTIYVSLEPCAHFGKTPPCADLIIEHRFKKVVIACLDPFAEVNGKGAAKLKATGIEVQIGVLEKEALELNRRFITFHEQKRPYIILKWAETADGFVDATRTTHTQKPLKITGEASDMLHHKWRTEEAAILIGKHTAMLDNPSLTARKFAGRNPSRIVLDAQGELEPSLKIFNDASKTIRISLKGTRKDVSTAESLFMNDLRNLNEMMQLLHARQIQSIIIEGGPTVQKSFYEAGLWDEMRRFVSPITVGTGVKALAIKHQPEAKQAVGNDQLYTYRNR